MGAFASLFQSGKIGDLLLKNRLIMPAMGGIFGDPEGRLNDALLDFYRTRARGGVGLIFPRAAGISDDAPLAFHMSLHDDTWIDDWDRLIQAIHELDTKIGAQLMHFGMLYLYAGYIPKGTSIKVPSMSPWLNTNLPYHVLNEDDIQRYVADFVEAALRAKTAGADLVELHACHGCLVGSFMSPLTNQRTDRYGGSPENRARFAREIISAMRTRVGYDYPLVARINASDDIKGGITPEEAVEHALILESAGIDAISISSGIEFWSTSTIPCYPYPRGAMLPLVDKIKQAVKVPVIATGKIDAEMAEEVVASGRAEFVGMARPLLADPYLPAKMREGRMDEARRCIYCMNCLKTDPKAGPGACTVNPFLYRESAYPLPHAETPARVMVVGGGLAGMQTAVLLAEKGHKVTLYERSSKLGGQWNTASATPGKEGYAAHVDNLKRLLAMYGVKVMLDTEVTAKMVLGEGVDAVVVATGAEPVRANIPGIWSPNVVQANDVIDGRAQVKGKAVIVGGRFIGIEVAIWLAEEGKDVCLVTQAGLGQNGITLEKQSFKTLAQNLIDLRVPLYLHSKLLEITDTHVFFRMGDDIFWLEADTVILAIGMKANNSLARELEGRVDRLYMVGDCVQPRDAAEVAYQAMKVASEI